MSKILPQALYSTGSDGSDFIHRQQIAGQYQISTLNKYRLKYCLFFHALLLCVMLMKLSPDILDKLDVFILEIEELQVPRPHWWEYFWCLSVLSISLSLSAIQRNNTKILKYFIISIIVFGYVPLFYGFCYYFKPISNYFIHNDVSEMEFWKGYPYGLLWYVFIIVGFQIHLFSLLFARNLLKAWTSYSKKLL